MDIKQQRGVCAMPANVPSHVAAGGEEDQASSEEETSSVHSIPDSTTSRCILEPSFLTCETTEQAFWDTVLTSMVGACPPETPPQRKDMAGVEVETCMQEPCKLKEIDLLYYWAEESV